MQIKCRVLWNVVKLNINQFAFVCLFLFQVSSNFELQMQWLKLRGMTTWRLNKFEIIHQLNGSFNGLLFWVRSCSEIAWKLLWKCVGAIRTALKLNRCGRWKMLQRIALQCQRICVNVVLKLLWICSETAPVSIYWTIWNRMPENLSESFWNCSVTALVSRLPGLKLATALKLLWELIECHQLQWRADELEIRRWIGAGCGQCVLFKWKHNQSTAPTNRANKSKHHQQQLPLINDNECSFTPTLEYFSAIDSKIPSQCSSITVDLEMSLQKS